MKPVISSVEDLIKAAGGLKATSEILATTSQNVWNWRTAGKIPARFHLVHRKALQARGFRVADSCWGFLEAAE